METIEYRVIDKSGWRYGPWRDEPDKRQWQDAATGLPCLIVRGPSGALCGYVGVAPGHPLHGVDYSGVAPLPKDTLRNALDGRGVLDLYADDLEEGAVRVESIIDVHGGLTFADGCTHIDPERWAKARTQYADSVEEAKRYPRGDSAERVKEWGDVVDDYDKWAERMRARSICHMPSPGEPDNVWWFGFDCAHSGDECPKSDYGRDGIYRPISYVTQQCELLAKQLAELGKPSP